MVDTVAYSVVPTPTDSLSAPPSNASAFAARRLPVAAHRGPAAATVLRRRRCCAAAVAAAAVSRTASLRSVALGGTRDHALLRCGEGSRCAARGAAACALPRVLRALRVAVTRERRARQGFMAFVPILAPCVSTHRARCE
jgi:hypothetical protein